LCRPAAGSTGAGCTCAPASLAACAARGRALRRARCRPLPSGCPRLTSPACSACPASRCPA
jgi:hypothetical protein